jgi:predicted metalloendopeptidase
VAFRQREQVLLVPYVFAGFDRIAHPGEDPSEHLADITGLRIAYDAFEQEMQGNPRPRVDGLTPEQRFLSRTPACRVLRLAEVRRPSGRGVATSINEDAETIWPTRFT